jgi:hypothetical protein
MTEQGYENGTLAPAQIAPSRSTGNLARAAAEADKK